MTKKTENTSGKNIITIDLDELRNYILTDLYNGKHGLNSIAIENIGSILEMWLNALKDENENIHFLLKTFMCFCNDIYPELIKEANDS